MSEDLYNALYHIVQFAEAEGWEEATTGRQILLKDAQKAIESWNTRPDSKPYKYADICEAWLGTPAVGKIGVYDAFVMGFRVARELKE